MELVYLWVEGYKNIKRQGFNFSPKFDCEFKAEYEKDSNDKEILKDGCELVIKPKEHLKNFFGKNINITAIVGENGSGKSSVLVGITNHKIVVLRDGKFFSNDFGGVKCNVELLEHNIKDDYEIIYLDYDFIKINPVRSSWDWHGKNIYDKNLYRKVENREAGSYEFNIGQFRKNFYNIIVNYREAFKSELFFFNPIEIILSDYINENLPDKKEWEHINKLIQDVKENKYSKEKFLVFLYSDVNSRNTYVNNIDDLVSIESEILEYAKLGNIKEIYDFFESLNEFSDKTKIPIKKFSVVYNKHKEAFLKLIEIGYLQTDFSDSIGREYFDLSQGERKNFTESLMIYDAITKSKNNNILLVLDEPDLTLHPDWQKKYISELIKLLSNFPDNNFHVIITSHSPFILSDIPKENVIFLEKYKKDDIAVINANQEIDNCKNATTDISINPFGANIHTLLSHGFFMKDGLMGEFAKSKITEIKRFYELIKKLEVRITNDKHTKKLAKNSFRRREKRFKNIQSIIGEPFLKTIMGNYLDELHLLFSDDDTLIDKELLELEERRTYLERIKNA